MLLVRDNKKIKKHYSHENYRYYAAFLLAENLLKTVWIEDGFSLNRKLKRTLKNGGSYPATNFPSMTKCHENNNIPIRLSLKKKLNLEANNNIPFHGLLFLPKSDISLSGSSNMLIFLTFSWRSSNSNNSSMALQCPNFTWHTAASPSIAGSKIRTHTDRQMFLSY